VTVVDASHDRTTATAGSAYRIGPLVRYLVVSRLGRDLVLPLAALLAMVVYLRWISPAFRVDAEGRLAITEMVVLAILPFVFAEQGFRPQGWMRTFLAARDARHPLVRAHLISRLLLAGGVLAVCCLLVVVAGDGVSTEGRVLVSCLAFLNLVVYFAALGSAMGQVTRGRSAILLGYLVPIALVVAGASMPAESRPVVWAVLVPAPLFGSDTAATWVEQGPLHGVIGLSSSVLWWVVFHRIFTARTRIR
jgi:hypothetical protein